MVKWLGKRNILEFLPQEQVNKNPVKINILNFVVWNIVNNRKKKHVWVQTSDISAGGMNTLANLVFP